MPDLIDCYEGLCVLDLLGVESRVDYLVGTAGWAEVGCEA